MLSRVIVFLLLVIVVLIIVGLINGQVQLEFQDFK